MEESCPERALEVFKEEEAKTIVKCVIDTLINADFSVMLNSEYDIDFALDPLLYSFRLPEVEGSLSIFSRWLIDPSKPNAILNHERYNKYIRQIFNSIPLIYELRKNHTAKALDDTFNFLKKTITPSSDTNDSNWKHPFEPETWSSSLRCIVNSINKTDPKNDTDIWDKLMVLFVEGILISDLKIEETDQLINSFFKTCFTANSNGQLLNFDKYWYKLFTEIFYQFLSFPKDEKKRNFILNLIMIMKSCSKEFENRFLNNSSVIVINWPIREKIFTIAMKCIKDVQVQHGINGIFHSKFAGEAIMHLFGDSMFVSNFWDFHILDNIKELFSLFSYGEFDSDSKWPEIFMKYLCFLMEKKAWNSLFKVVYGIMNASSLFVAQNPSLFSKILNLLLSRASSLDLPYFTLVNNNNSNSSSSINSASLLMKPDVIPNPNLFASGAWVSTMSSLLEFSRVEENRTLEDRILAVIEKFCNCSELPFIIDDFNVYRLFLLANAGKEDLFAKLIAQKAPTARSLRVERIWDFELLILAFSPLFMPDFVGKIIEKQVMENILANFNSNEFSDRHIFWFLITLLELSISTDLFVRNRTIIARLVAFLIDQRRQRKATETSKPKNMNWFINKMIEIVYYIILVPTISCANAKEFNSKYQKIKIYATNDRIFTFGENEESNTFGLIVRGPFGISSFDITEAMTPVKQPTAENTLKENILHRDEIQFPEESVFPVYKDTLSVSGTIPNQKKCIYKTFLMAMGFSSIESNMSFYSTGILDNSSSEVEKALNEFDQLSEIVPFDVKVACLQINNSIQKGENSYSTFVDDLGKSFKLGSCIINFKNDEKFETNDIIVVFNYSGLKISNKMVARLEKDENAASKNNNVKLLNNNLVIEVAPISNSISKSTLLYQVTILKSKWKCLILPFPAKKPVVASRKNLSRLISMICFFYFSRLGKDETLKKTVVEEDECPKIVAKCIEIYEKRKEKLDNLLKLQNKEDTIFTIINE